MTSRRRFTALDGLRGIAALVVVVHHSLLTAPALAEPYRDGGSPATGWVGLLTNTPLHLVWGGGEAVYLFFVLSGFVLTLPFLRRDRPSWIGYYPRRLLRLYLPVWAAVLFAVALTAVAPRHADPAQSWWVNAHDFGIGPRVLGHELTLVFGTNLLNSPLWSLRWEVIFSLLLPLYVALAVKVRRAAVVVVALLLAAVVAGQANDIQALTYLPMFGVGAVMAVHRETLSGWAARLGRVAWAVLFAVGVLLFTAPWTVPPPIGTAASSVAGSALIVFMFLSNPPAQRVGDSAVVQWLGSRSFSIYLVHEPIVVSVAVAAKTGNAGLVAAVALPLSLLAGEVFFRLVEAPAHRLASVVGKRLDRARLHPLENLRHRGHHRVGDPQVVAGFQPDHAVGHPEVVEGGVVQ